MQQVGVIQLIEKHTPVLSPLAIVKQNGKLRLCLYPTNVNIYVLRSHYPLKILEEILDNLKKIFTKLGFLRASHRLK